MARNVFDCISLSKNTLYENIGPFIETLFPSGTSSYRMSKFRKGQLLRVQKKLILKNSYPQISRFYIKQHFYVNYNTYNNKYISQFPKISRIFSHLIYGNSSGGDK